MEGKKGGGGGGNKLPRDWIDVYREKWRDGKAGDKERKSVRKEF